MAVIEFPGIFKRLFREQGESLIVKEPVMPLKENGGIAYESEGTGLYVNVNKNGGITVGSDGSLSVNVSDGGGINVGSDGSLSVNIADGGGLAQNSDGGIYVDIADGGGLMHEDDGSLAVDMSDTYDPGSSEVAASTNALKDLYDKLNARITELEEQIASGTGDSPLMPSAETLSCLTIEQDWSQSSTYMIATLPEGGTWAWALCVSYNPDYPITSGTHEGTRTQLTWKNAQDATTPVGTACYYGVNAGGTVVRQEYWKSFGYDSGDNTYSANYETVYFAVCWRIA